MNWGRECLRKYRLDLLDCHIHLGGVFENKE